MTTRAVMSAMVLIACSIATGAFAQSTVLDAKRRTELSSGSSAQRTEVLAWLAEHGSQSDTPAVVPRLQDADQRIRALAESTLWSMWLRSGDDQADAWMNEGSTLATAAEYDSAIAVFTRVIQRLPDFAEAYNKRATVLYLKGDYEGSLADIATTLKINPAHFGALSGAGLCMIKLHRPDEALFYFERGLAVNPNMDGIRDMVNALHSSNPRPRA